MGHTSRLGRGHVRRALTHLGFRRLFGTRLAGQFGDGVFQASLAGAVLFNPEHQARAADVAAGFAVILLPYSLIGPFAGVLLDRWWRQRVLVVANVLRAVGVIGVGIEIATGLRGQPFYASVLVVVSFNRFVLSALSTGLPHVVDSEELVTANALSSTFGALSTSLGGGLAIGVRLLVGGGSDGYAAMAIAAAAPYLFASWVARGFGLHALGPDAAERAGRETARAIARGLAAGARHVRQHRPALNALAMIGLHRACYGVSTVCILLLYRNYFTNDGFFRAGLAGLGQIVAMVALGSGLAALVTPAVTRRIGFVRWSVLLLLLAAVAEIGLGLPYSMPLLLLGALVLGFAAQAIKICVDTQLQQSIADDFRGRVFSLYDTLFNLTFVGAAVFTAIALPESGRSPASVLAIGLGYALIAAVYVRSDPDRVLAPAPNHTEPEAALIVAERNTTT